MAMYDPQEILDVEAASDAFALAMTDVLMRTDPLMHRARTYECVRQETSLAVTDIRDMILGIPDINEWGEGVSR